MFKSSGFHWHLVLSLVVCASCSGLAWAQASDPADSPAVWEQQAKTVARALDLDKEKTAKLVEAYKEARTSQQAAVREKIGEGGRPSRENYAAIREVTAAEQKKLEQKLNEFLTPEQTKKALASLGSFSRRWDRMVAALDGMNLEEKVKTKAMDAVLAYVEETGAIMGRMGAQSDREALREKFNAAREKLDGEMAKILSPEQLTKWREATSRRRGR